MPIAPTMPRVSTGLMMTVSLHLAVLYALLRTTATPPTAAPHRAQPPIQWLRLLPPPRLASPPKSATSPISPISTTSHAQNKPSASPSSAAPAAAPLTSTRSEPITAEPTAPADEPPTPDLTTSTAPAPRSAADILQQARRDLAGIDRELRREHPERGIAAPPDSKQRRLERGFEAAHAA